MPENEKYFIEATEDFKKNNLSEAFKNFKKAAENGHSEAEIILGTFYEFGLLGERDIETARDYYMSALNRGNKKAEKSITRISPQWQWTLW